MPFSRVAFGALVVLGSLTGLTGGTSASTRHPLPATLSCPQATIGVLNSAPPAGRARTVALTFDDGPGASTGAILNILTRLHVRATFFNIGQQVSERPSLVREEANDGFLLGDHTNSHPNLAHLSRADQLAEVDQVAVIEHRLTGSPICVFRPPYGSYDAATRQVAAERGMSLWMWSDGGGDWLAGGSGSSHWVSTIERAVESAASHQTHPVVLLHNQRAAMPATVAALPSIIRWFRARHYTFVDLLGRRGPPASCGTAHAPFAVPATTYPDGSTLEAGQSWSSPSGQYTLNLAASGRLSWAIAGGRTLWTHDASTGSALKVRDGALELVGPEGSLEWRTPGATGAVPHLGDDGGLTIVGSTGVLWRGSGRQSGLQPGDQLRPGWRLYSPSGGCELLMLPHGNLELRTADGQTFWHDLVGARGAVTTLDQSGNLVTRGATGIQVWSSGTSGHPGARLSVGDHGRVLLFDSHGDHLWATP